MDVIIFGGQSNMQGQTECLSDESVVHGAFEYKWIGDYLKPLKNPVGENIRYDGSEGYPVTKDVIEAGLNEWLSEHALAASCFGHTNLVPKFCEAYLKEKYGEAEYGSKLQKGEALLTAVHTAKGSTRIKEWLPGTKAYEVLVRKAKGALELVKNSGIEHVYFVWLQGESDALASVSKEAYKEALRTLKAGLMKDLQAEKFGIIRVGCFTEDARDWEIIHAQSEICKEDTDFVMLTELAVELNKQPLYMNPEYHGHYSAAGIEKLGSAAGRTLAGIPLKLNINMQF